MNARFGSRSTGSGGATGCTANTSRCAVVGCEQRGKPQVCPYDGAYHRHGAIHYDSGYPKHSLTFHAGDWYWICDDHYKVCCDERLEFENRERAK